MDGSTRLCASYGFTITCAWGSPTGLMFDSTVLLCMECQDPRSWLAAPVDEEAERTSQCDLIVINTSRTISRYRAALKVDNHV